MSNAEDATDDDLISIISDHEAESSTSQVPLSGMAESSKKKRLRLSKKDEDDDENGEDKELKRNLSKLVNIHMQQITKNDRPKSDEASVLIQSIQLHFDSIQDKDEYKRKTDKLLEFYMELRTAK